jgi:two-component system phosphate regulon response regulator PhoB
MNAPAGQPAAASPRAHILVVEDDSDIQELIRYNLARERFKVTVASTGEEALKLAHADPPDLVLLDLMLPGMDGLEVCRRLKRQTRTAGARVMMLTAKGEEADIVAGLELGSDDYIVKPFSPRVLLAHIKAVLRRSASGDDGEAPAFRRAGLTIRPERHEALLDGRPVDLTLTEFRILQLLARRPGWVYTRAQIVDSARGADYPVTDRSVDVHVAALRKKLGQAGDLIETVRGVGYRLRDDEP